MIGMQTPVTRDILPYTTVAGTPARILGFNRIGAERKSYEATWLDEMEAYLQYDVSIISTSDNPMVQQIHAFLMEHPEALIKVN